MSGIPWWRVPLPPWTVLTILSLALLFGWAIGATL